MSRDNIAQEFLDGVYEVFDTILSSNIYIKLLDEENSVPDNIYGEAQSKVYHPPLKLVGKFSLTMKEGEQPIEGIQDFAVAKIATKSLIDNGIDISPQNYSYLHKAVIVYDGVEYPVQEVTPTTNVDDVFLFFEFKCLKPKVRGDYA